MYDSFTFLKKIPTPSLLILSLIIGMTQFVIPYVEVSHNYFSCLGFTMTNLLQRIIILFSVGMGFFVWYCVKQTFLQGKEKHFQVYNQRKSYRFSWKKFAFNIFDSSANNIAAVGNTNEDFCMNMAWCLWQK